MLLSVMQAPRRQRVNGPEWDDTEYINQCLSAGPPGAQPLGSGISASERCRWCCHNQHGLPCTGSCTCDGSYSSRDDSWRPVDTHSSTPAGQVRVLANQCGIDGWAANAAIPSVWRNTMSPAAQAQAYRIKILLLHGTRDPS